MNLVVKRHRPMRRAVIIGGFVIAAGLAVAVAFHYGQWNYITSSLTASGTKKGLIEENVDLKKQLSDAARGIAKLEREIAINEKARVDYQSSIAKLTNDVAELKLELAFYRDILSSTEPESGPKVRGFKLRDFGGNGRYQYRLVLTHVNKDDKVADGRVSVEIRGQQAGADQRLKLSEISESGAEALAFRFKHFRRIEGILEIPADFLPREVSVAVHENGRRKSSFSQVYKWAALIN